MKLGNKIAIMRPSQLGSGKLKQLLRAARSNTVNLSKSVTVNVVGIYVDHET